jgi:hypothetical protein
MTRHAAFTAQVVLISTAHNIARLIPGKRTFFAFRARQPERVGDSPVLGGAVPDFRPSRILLESAPNEDEELRMIYGRAVTRRGGKPN